MSGSTVWAARRQNGSPGGGRGWPHSDARDVGYDLRSRWFLRDLRTLPPSIVKSSWLSKGIAPRNLVRVFHFPPLELSTQRIYQAFSLPVWRGPNPRNLGLSLVLEVKDRMTRGLTV